ncbi:hypothetical protein Bca4012_045318 [Brassica carinata]
MRDALNEKSLENFEDGIENIHIGGPAMIRAAAKNHKDVLIVVLEYLKGGQNDQQFRSKLAWKAFQHVAAYDSAVSEWLWKQAEGHGDSGGGYGGFGSRKPLEVQARTGSTQSVSTSDLTGSHGGEEGHYHELPYEPHNEYPLQPDHMTTPLLQEIHVSSLGDSDLLNSYADYGRNA